MGTVDAETEHLEPVQATAAAACPHQTPATGWRGLGVVLLVVLADWLFYGRPLGWALGAYGGLLILALVLAGARPAGGWPAWWVGAGALSLCVRCAVEPNRLTLALGALFLVSLALTLREGWQRHFLIWVRRWGHFLCGGMAASVAALVAGIGLLRARIVGSGDAHKGLLRAWLVPLVLGAVFVALFGLANPVIANGLSAAWEALTSACRCLPSPARCLFWLGTGCGLWALLQYRTGVHETGVVRVGDGKAGDWAGFLTPAVVRRALLVFNLLFAVQTGMDLWYLWGGAALPQGLTYAEYARRGAYPLVATALLAALFVLLAFRAGAAAGTTRTAHRLVYVWLLQNVFLMVSAAWRLWLYVNAYSLTRLRLAAGVWMVLVACGLIWIMVRVLTSRSNQWLIDRNAATLVTVLYVCAWTGADRWVAAFNVRHCAESGVVEARPLDLAYLARLGYDALPALAWLAERNTDPRKAGEIDDLVRSLTARLDADLRDWRGWTRRRANIQASMTSDAAADALAATTEGCFAFGKVLSLTGREIRVLEYDFERNASAIVAYTVTPETAYDNGVRLSDLEAGDDILVDYLERGGRRRVTTLVREEKVVENAPAAPTLEAPLATAPIPTPAPAPALPAPVAVAAPAVPTAPTPVVAAPGPTTGSGRIVAVAAGKITIRELSAAGEARSADYSIIRKAEFRGLASPSDLKSGDAVSFEYSEKNGRRWITMLSRARKP
jgi:hypothetical protein